MNERILVRNATEADVEAIVTLNHGLFQEDAGQRDPFMDLDWPLAHGHEYFSTLVVRDEVCCLLAEKEGRAVGYLIGYLRKPSSLRPIKLAELESMFILAEYRGSGVGSELISRFRSWCQAHDVERLTVTAYAANQRAIAFYKRHGFVPKSLVLEAEASSESGDRASHSFPDRVAAELAAARVAHAPMNSLHEGYGVLLEEVDELWEEIKAKVRNRQKLEDETVQIAAMCQRLYEDVIVRRCDCTKM